ncbi:hypothetical protein RB601_003785 [Gaeumannomyces tritici]
MLSAFTARPIIELKPRYKSKIETVLAYGDRVLVGLNTGDLRVYRLNDTATNGHPEAKPKDVAPAADGGDAPPPPLEPLPTALLREVEKFSTRAIEQLAIIKEANTLVSLSNYAVSLHDLSSFEPIEAPLANTRNATCFAITSNVVKDPTGVPEIVSRLAVAVKRRLYLWTWHEYELSPDVAEVVLPESIRSLTWASATKIVCGMNSEYMLVDVTTKETSSITGGHVGSGGGAGAGAQGGVSRFGAYSTAGMGYMGLGGYMPKPLATKLGDGELLLAKDINTMFINDEGKLLEKRQVPWQFAPESVGYSYPYLLALQPPAKGGLEVRNPDTLSLLQTISLPGATQLHFPPPAPSLPKGFHISSDRFVWKMNTTDYDEQVNELMAAARYDEAISILNMLEDALLKNKTEVLREVKMQKAELLFRQGKFRESMDLFNEDSVHAPPDRVLRLFPPVIAGELSACAVKGDDEDAADHDDTDGKTDGVKDCQKSDSPPTSAAAAAVAAAAETAETVTRTGGFARMFLGGGRKAVDSDAASIASTKKSIGDADDDAKSIKARPVDDGVLDGKELRDAVLELNGYLAGARARLQRVIDPVTGKLKPSRDASAEEAFRSLLGSHQDESEEQLEKDLQEAFKLVDTSLFRAYMFANPNLARSLFRIPNFCDPEVVNAKLLEHNSYTPLIDFFHGKKLHRQALELLKRFGSGDQPEEVPEALHGPERTVRYLQSLPPEMIDLILEFSEWTLKAAPGLAMEVFVADTENAETLPRHKVVEFLGRIDVELEVQYLDHIISELNDMTPDFHNRLVDILIKHLQTKEKGEEWNLMMDRLLRFLKEGQYGLHRAFDLIDKEDPAFYEAQAIVLSNMGSHRQALEIYVFDMKDYAKAEEYCNQVHKTEGAAGLKSMASPPSYGEKDPFKDDEKSEPSIHHTLLSLYLNPPTRRRGQSSPSPNRESALDLLSKHGSRLPASSTLSLLPDSLPVSELEAYFRGQIRSSNSVVNEGRVVAGMRKTELVSAQARLLLGDDGAGGARGVPEQGGRSRRVVISEERVCGVCHKRLGGSVIAVLPDNTVVHYGCLNKATRGGVASKERASKERGPSWGRVGGY